MAYGLAERLGHPDPVGLLRSMSGRTWRGWIEHMATETGTPAGGVATYVRAPRSPRPDPATVWNNLVTMQREYARSQGA